MRDSAFATLQRALPTHALSRAWLRFTHIQSPWISQPSIRLLSRLYGIDLSEAREPDPKRYPSLNAFFTRAIKTQARPLPEDTAAIACPVDGTLSQAGEVNKGRIMQAKGHDYDVVSLLGGNPALAEPFLGGCFCTLYLAPRDYHRVHMPSSARLEEMIHVPGRLFSVNPATTRALPGLFTRNERVATLWQTPAGPMALVLVGAMLVGSIDTVWSGQVTPSTGKHPDRVRYPESGPARVELERGQEMGRFNMGSSVVLVYGDGVADWLSGLRPGMTVRQGARLGRLRTS